MLRPLLLLGACLLIAPGMAAAQPRGAGTVNVLYAGSLVSLMEHGIVPAFDQAAGATVQGFAGGSNALANEIKGRLRRGDVFISANPTVNDALTGATNGDWVRWYIAFAQSAVVIGYNPSSRFAADLRSKPWYEVLQEPGIRIGRTDPKLDPKGALTVQLLQHAEQVYRQPGLALKVLGAPENPEQVRPEENLVGRLQSGQTRRRLLLRRPRPPDLRIPAIPLPPEVALAAHYTATVLRDGGANPAGAAQVRGLPPRAQPGQDSVMRAHGLDNGAADARWARGGGAGGDPAGRQSRASRRPRVNAASARRRAGALAGRSHPVSGGAVPRWSGARLGAADWRGADLAGLAHAEPGSPSPAPASPPRSWRSAASRSATCWHGCAARALAVLGLLGAAAARAAAAGQRRAAAVPARLCEPARPAVRRPADRLLRRHRAGGGLRRRPIPRHRRALRLRRRRPRCWRTWRRRSATALARCSGASACRWRGARSGPACC